jgi:hypothetical protein
VRVGAALDALSGAADSSAREVSMAILRSLDGKFYELPDDLLSRYLIPADKVKERLGGNGGDPDALDDDTLKAVRGGSTSAAAWHNVWHNRI